MFRDSAGPGLRALIFFVLSIVLIMLYQRSDVFRSSYMRFSASVAYPFQWTIDAPIRFSQWVTASVTTERALLHENEALRVREILL